MVFVFGFGFGAGFLSLTLNQITPFLVNLFIHPGLPQGTRMSLSGLPQGTPAKKFRHCTKTMP